MAENSKIEWCDHTFNPWIGCTKVSTGCANCYAENMMDKRLKQVSWGKGNLRKRTSAAYWKLPIKWNIAAKKSGIRPRVFCASLADWLDDEVPIEWLADLLVLIRLTPNLDWLLLTKRPELWAGRVSDVYGITAPCYEPSVDWMDTHFKCYNWLYYGEPPPNVWIGTSVENQEMADKRIPEMLEIPAKVHFLSCEPLLGQLSLLEWGEPQGGGRGYIKDIDWVICGGESGPLARPMYPNWARTLRDQCTAAGVPYFFKQWGRPSTLNGAIRSAQLEAGADNSDSKGGRFLDGLEHKEFPVLEGGA